MKNSNVKAINSSNTSCSYLVPNTNIICHYFFAGVERGGGGWGEGDVGLIRITNKSTNFSS